MTAYDLRDIHVSSARFPLLVVEFVGKATDDQFRQYLDNMDAHIARCLKEGKKSVVLVDTLKATSPVSPSQRKLQAEWMARSFQSSQRSMAGMVFVIDSVLVRGVLTAILWLQKMPCEHAVFGSRAEAEDWANSKLAHAGSQQTAYTP